MVNAERRPWPGFKPAFRDVHPTDFTAAIGAGGDPRQGRIDVLEALLALVKEGGRLRQLEGYGAALRIMFVVHIGVLAGGIDRRDVAPKI
ncbi:hypothetical protein StoSoilB3_20380 [Arthrobacter sp. StoSoilB3]|nr:hypothetical protein StoSoilB3_20380 [Arthrobacter sp. StoSoilB3]